MEENENQPGQPGGQQPAAAVQGQPVEQQPAAAALGQPVGQQPAAAAAAGARGWINNREILLLVVTLITTLTYQVGTNPPGGYWQDDSEGHGSKHGIKMHVAGHPIMRDKDKLRYRALMVANWISFYVSMVLTVYLIRELQETHKAVKLLFLCSYTLLVFTYNVSQSGTSLPLDLALWLFFLAFALYAFFTST